MSILIKGMEMPKNCLECDWCAHTIPADNYICYRLNRAVIGVAKEDVNETVNACCPILPVPSHDGEAFEKVISERIAQIEKWGDEPCNHPFEWMSILGEEFGELCEAVNETCFMNGTHPERGGDKNIIREATQIAAVAIAIIRDFLPPIIPAEEGEK